MGILTVSSGKVLQVGWTQKNQWHTMNTAEKYINLLIYWLYKANVRLIRKPDGALDSALYILSSLSRNLKSERFYELCLFHPKYQLATMELFGFFDIKPKPPQDNQSWEVDDIQLTSFGHVMLMLFKDMLRCKTTTSLFSLESAEDYDYRQKFAEFSVCIPSCQQFIEQQPIPYYHGSYVLKIFLNSAKKNVWREVELSSESDFHDLANAILRFFDFDYDHLYRFSIEDDYGNVHYLYHPYCQESGLASEVKLGVMGLEPGQTFQFVYDFGEHWEFLIKVKSFSKGKQGQDVCLLKSKGVAPDQYHDSNYY